MTEKQIENYIQEQFLKNSHSHLLGILFFGSRIKLLPEEISDHSDYDIGIIYSGEIPEIEIPDNWDLFLWSLEKWNQGFALQVELARYAKILYDPEQIIIERFSMIREKILPHWLAYLKKF